ncbi:lipoyl(octanoyl) transferase LipB [Polaromonas sp. JS666]|uniref:Octanoyltransferase n=1 Tax=Polaromonas sp. (strain JS666 / ATCC BAA-500) TaxID=296591 RepID=LIPB_POLSJ|nr:lipoyl(octanoyl) transferase LipB [Polaromonas sp. JS666]Q12GR3.1 RecName: Full=Octanoyltransferase; AltName: Full=Lipoate-protein ligase B; AltName: Full=Lipoyl/octanoyl transferase; AltName: Full=Octanoyl-[acyl-carrier-protein]-protein N-octanoyltransferase [Polaromonas sp. JS666]ABE42279.1 lipoate-protein ligase B [Polaromonas sp. JS666]
MNMEIRHLGRVDYLPTYEAMQAFTLERTAATPNSLWICEHPPVYTQGLAGKIEHVLNPGDIPVVQTNRGGQVTYHGPGQVVAYPLIDLKQAGYYVKEYVYRIEEAVIRTLSHFGVTGHRVPGAPGIYVRLDDPFSHARLRPSPQPSPKGRGSSTPVLLPPLPGEGGGGGGPDPDPFHSLGKIAALGIKVSRHCTYHGVALNVAMDLEPFSRINPCGYAGLKTVDLRTIGVSVTWQEAADVLGQKLSSYLAP